MAVRVSLVLLVVALAEAHRPWRPRSSSQVRHSVIFDHRCDLSPPCKNGGTCIKINMYGYRCKCPSPYNGKNCDKTIPLPPTTSSIRPQPTPTGSSSSPSRQQTIIYDHICDIGRPCRHGGTCLKANNIFGYRCSCIPPWYGKQCEKYNVSSQQTSTPPLLVTDGATATSGSSLQTSSTPPLVITDWAPATTIAPPSSSSRIIIYDHICDIVRPCRHGGTCLKANNIFGYRCSCIRPWYGKQCKSISFPQPTMRPSSTRFAISSVLPSSSSVIVWDHRCFWNHCQNGGTCVKYGLSGVGCQCSPPYYGKYCGSSSVRAPISTIQPSSTRSSPSSSSSVIIWDDRCLCNPCLNGGSCVTQGQYDIACQCSPPYYGKYCDSKSISTIQPSSTRFELSSSSSSSVFIWDDRCLWNPCQNGGSCVKQGQYDIACQCSPPYYGKYCGSKSISTIQPSSTRFAISSSSSSLYSVIYDHICDIGRPCPGGTCVKTNNIFGYTCSYSSSSVRAPISTIQPSRVSRSSRPPLSTVQKRSHPVDKRSQTSDASCEHLSSMTQRVFADPRVDWKNIHPAIKDVAINLVRHDDHKGISPRAHALIRHALATNSLKDMRRIMSQRKNWKRVPINHFMLRKKHLDEALKNPFGFVLKRQSKMMTCE